MLDRKQLPFLVRLLDDDTPGVRDQVVRELLAYGPALEEELHGLGDALTQRQLAAVHALLAHRRELDDLREAWRRWPSIPDEMERLERAFEVLALVQYGWIPPVRLRDLLDDLAGSFYASGLSIDPMGLSRFLFTRQFRGNVEDYYDPLNSNLIHALQTGRGLPISLACIFILVGHRVGVEIYGCSVPGHFLARARVAQRDVYFDCFNGGRLLSLQEVEERRANLAPHHQHLLTEPADAVSVMTRVLHNLMNAYDLAEEPEKTELMRALLRDLRQATVSA